MQEHNDHRKLTEQERKRLTLFFDALLEMHVEYKRHHKGSSEENDALLKLKPGGEHGAQQNLGEVL